MTTAPGGDELRIRRFLRDRGLGIPCAEPVTSQRTVTPARPVEPRWPAPLSPALLVAYAGVVFLAVAIIGDVLS
ncbi:hypothetical protein C5746_02595 [Streptomyces atratus]|uniref:Uncharacterized protein n=1 Tax=Streptomyces atratus TaxID=1893 RepID=A0A2Z5J6U9_STRAR|nr:hypothetical protein C5746_02595 [Streptomyces atratus]